jgi:hypothetical protein
VIGKYEFEFEFESPGKADMLNPEASCVCHDEYRLFNEVKQSCHLPRISEVHHGVDTELTDDLRTQRSNSKYR